VHAKTWSGDALLVNPLTDSAEVSPNHAAREFTSFLVKHRSKVLALLAGYLLLLSIIGLQNVPYLDDNWRRATGATGWGDRDGRWGSEFVGRLLNQGVPLIDLGLVTFIVAAVFLAIASCIVIWALVRDRANWLTFAIALTFGMNPWLLSAFGFRFDAPYFALSILVAVSSLFVYRSRPLTLAIGYLLAVFITANFFQPMLGLIVILLLTSLLLDWVAGSTPTRTLLARLGFAVVGACGGGLLYVLQHLILGGDRGDIPFDLANPVGAMARNFPLFLRHFWADSTTLWIFLYGIVIAAFVAHLMVTTARSRLLTFVIVLVYGVLIMIAAGSVLLFTAGEIVGQDARFRAPLAMAIALLAVIATTATFPRVIGPFARLALGYFAYCWLAITFIFAMLLHEQQDSFRFQAATIASDIYAEYRPGDNIIYDPNIFRNPPYFYQAIDRFPIFDATGFADRLLWPEGFTFTRFRFASLLGMDFEQLILDQNQDCARVDQTGKQVTHGPRWDVFRVDDQTLCVTIPAGQQ